MIGSLLITLREGLEAALIIGIILGYLSRVGQRKYFSHIFGGALAGLAASAVAAVLFNILAGGFEGRAEQIFEGVVMVAAVMVLTSMILWMRRQSRSMSTDIQKKVDEAISGGKVWGLVSLAFLSVFREGVEVVLFMSVAAGGSEGAVMVGSTVQGNSFIGGILGLLTALIVAFILFRSSVKLNLKTFFTVTGALVILIAAGMLAGAIHEFEEAGVIPVIIEHIWDLNGFLNEKGIAGSFLKTVFGYNGNPSLLEALSYAAYLGIVTKAYFGRSKTVKS